MTLLTARSVTLTRQSVHLLKNVSLEIKSRELVCLIGPNGAGKSSLLRSLIGLEKLQSGIVEIDGKALSGLRPAERARKVSYLPQIRKLAWPLRVFDAVALGRFAYGVASARLSKGDREAIDSAINACDLLSFIDRRTDTLSGGELARVHIARALASKSPLILADEPLAALDPKHQLRVMNLLWDFTRNGGAALVVLHDISLAAQFADRLIWMKNAELIADGPPDETLTSSTMRQVFDVQAKISEGHVLIDDLG